MRGHVPQRRPARLAALLGALVLAVAGLAACGDDDSNSGAGSSGAQGGSGAAERQSGSGSLPARAKGFVACLRDHGVDISMDDLSGGGSPIDPQDPEVRDAVFACRSKLPAGAGGGR
jgi:hypothetical protein